MFKYLCPSDLSVCLSVCLPVSMSIMTICTTVCRFWCSYREVHLCSCLFWYFPSGHLEPIFITHTKKVVQTRVLQHLRLDYCFGASHHYNITITVVADDQKSGFATYACKKTYNGGKCDIRTPYHDISGGSANFLEVSLDGPQDYGVVGVLVRGDGRYDQPNSYILAASAPYT